MVSFVRLERVVDTEPGHGFAERPVGANQTVLFTDVHHDRGHLFQGAGVRIEHGHRRVYREPGRDFRDDFTVLRRQVKVERGVFRVRRPGGGYRKGPQCSVRLGKILGCLDPFHRQGALPATGAHFVKTTGTQRIER